MPMYNQTFRSFITKASTKPKKEIGMAMEPTTRKRFQNNV